MRLSEIPLLLLLGIGSYMYSDEHSYIPCMHSGSVIGFAVLFLTFIVTTCTLLCRK